MCGRFSNGLTLEQYREAAQRLLPEEYDAELGPDASQYNRSYNVAPQTRALVLRAVKDRALDRTSAAAEKLSENADGESVHLVLQSMKWGLVPHSTKMPPKGPDAYQTINARDDTILSGSRLWSPLFKNPEHRCVVMIQGFFEWQKKGSESKPERIAHFVGMNDQGKGRKSQDGKEYGLMALAGLWEKVRYEGETEDLYTFTIITTESNKQLNWLHDRMPVILPDAQSIALWLDIPTHALVKKEDSESPSAAKLLKPYDRGELQCYRVPPEVGKVGNNDEKFIYPVSARKDGIMAAFGRAKAKTEPGSSSSAGIKKETSTQAESTPSQDLNSETHAPASSTTGKSKQQPSSTSQEPKASDPKKRKVQDEGGPSSKKTKSEVPSSPQRSPGKASRLSGSKKGGDAKASSSPSSNSGTRDIRSFFK
ncbi:hypothetical protein OC846_002232 [Tilletia horrida]|uniref:DUF159-domain-containing protein n=1 Tax=Tilletia horrida TaxID=155126 RepID=A0AAN6GU11_9BASI|nr:hypothetical protein OC846_002232 [Tilletia horrida]KAK0568977.1 hypothetical protein OC861_001414 [Tilletia horrida]